MCLGSLKELHRGRVSQTEVIESLPTEPILRDETSICMRDAAKHASANTLNM